MLKEAQDLVNCVMAEVDGFKDVHFTNNTLTIASANLETPKFFKVMVRQAGKLCPMAVVGEDMNVQWSNDGMPAVREALSVFMAELE